MTGTSHRVSLLLLVSLLSTACMLKPPPPATVPQWTAVPAVVVQAMCIKFHTEGMSGTVNVVTSTEPLITRESLIGLGEVADQADSKNDPSLLATSIAAKTPKLPVTVEVPEGCELHAVASAKEVRADEMLLQVSAPLVNPYEKVSAGLFARLSLGGENPQWYWVPVATTKEGKWLAGTPLSIAVPH